MAKTPLIIATREAIKVTIGCMFAIDNNAPDTLTMVAVSAELWFVILLAVVTV